MPNNAPHPQGKPALLLTRPQSSAAAFVARLDPEVLEGVTVCISPLLEIVPLQADVALNHYAGVVFTSANAVGCVTGGAGRLAYCVGARTAEAAAMRGWQVGRIGQDANDLVASLKAAPVKGPLLHLAGQHRRGEVAERLTALGILTDVTVVYDQILRPLTKDAHRIISNDKRVIVPLFSPRTAAHFVAEAGATNNVALLAISPAVAEAVKGFDAAEVHIASAPTAEEMRRAVEMLLAGDSLA